DESPPSSPARRRGPRFWVRHGGARNRGFRGQGASLRAARRRRARRDDRDHPARSPHRPNRAGSGSPPARDRRGDGGHRGAATGDPGALRIAQCRGDPLVDPRGTQNLVPFALDASVTLAWALPEESPAAKQAWTRIASDNVMVPALWWFELRNGLVVNERRGRITEAETTRFLRRLSRFPIVIDDAPNEAAAMSLARRHRLTVYDA